MAYRFVCILITQEQNSLLPFLKVVGSFKVLISNNHWRKDWRSPIFSEAKGSEAYCGSQNYKFAFLSLVYLCGGTFYPNIPLFRFASKGDIRFSPKGSPTPLPKGVNTS